MRRGPAVRVSLALIRGYKILISPYFRGSCRFLPSCADYAAEAIATHGFLRGGWLAARRLGRCHPLCHAGYDPVPARRSGVGKGFRSAESDPMAGNTCDRKPFPTPTVY